MKTALVGQVNTLSLPLVAKADGDPITAGTVNFYLVAVDGTNADKWYRESDTSWQVAESVAGVATHRADGHWYVSFPSAVWAADIRYQLYAKEDGNLHIAVGEDILGKVSDFEVILKAWAAGKWQLKTGTTATYEILDADDGVTVVMEITLAQTTPYKTVTIL